MVPTQIGTVTGEWTFDSSMTVGSGAPRPSGARCQDTRRPPRSVDGFDRDTPFRCAMAPTTGGGCGGGGPQSQTDNLIVGSTTSRRDSCPAFEDSLLLQAHN